VDILIRPNPDHMRMSVSPVPIWGRTIVFRSVRPGWYDLHGVRLNLDGLALALALDEFAADDHRAARGEAQHFVVVGQIVGDDGLDRIERRAVVDLDERQAGFRVASCSDPAPDGDG